MPPRPPPPRHTQPPLWLITALVLAAHAWGVQRLSGPPLPRTASAPPSARLAVRLLPALAPPPSLTRPATPPQRARPPKPQHAQARTQPVQPAPPLPHAQPASQASAAQAPPLYAVNLPAPHTLHYRSTQGAQTGQVQLRWAHDGQHYELQQSWQGPEQPAHRWLSRGQVAPEGIAPERLLEERRARAVQAVNFQRDKRLLSYSASALSSPLLAGTQDRASWLVQLAGIVHAQAATLQPGERLSLLVASPRGQLDTWVFELQARSAEPAAPLHWIREPQRPYDWRIELWLAPALHYLPQRLLWQLLPGGEPLLWELQTLATPPGAEAH